MSHQVKWNIDGRLVYGWKADQRKAPDENSILHDIVLVGTEERDTKQIVYFIDPMDRSDPKKPHLQKIYAMTYERLNDLKTIHPQFSCEIQNSNHVLPKEFVWAYRCATFDEITTASARKDESKKQG